MKRNIFYSLLAIVLCLALCACNKPTPAETDEGLRVHITVGKVEPGMTAKDVLVEVTVNNQPVACRVQLTGFVWDGYWEMAEDEPVPEDFSVRVDIFYSLPAGYDVEDAQITMDCDGGEYDGTGSISFDKEGNVEAWSRAFYGEEPLPPETQPTEETTQPIEQTQPTTPPETESQHTHSWTELPGPSIIDCNLESAKTFQCNCGETKTEIIPAPGHDLKDWTVTPATCTTDGRKTSSCKRCGAGFTVELYATGHTWLDWVNKTGLVHSRTCSICGAEEEANHNIPSGEVTCTDCGADIIN